MEAVRAEGLKVGLYYSIIDWHHPDFENNFEAYLDYLYKSVEILCTNYGKIGGLWFDGNWSKPDALIEIASLSWSYIHKKISTNANGVYKHIYKHLWRFPG